MSNAKEVQVRVKSWFFLIKPVDKNDLNDQPFHGMPEIIVFRLLHLVICRFGFKYEF